MHDDDYTPALIDLRVAYRLMEAGLMMGPNSKPHDPVLMAESDAEFDRAIAKIWADGESSGFYNGRHCELRGFEAITNPHKED